MYIKLAIFLIFYVYIHEGDNNKNKSEFLKNRDFKKGKLMITIHNRVGLTNNSRPYKNNKVGFAANPLVSLSPEKLMNRIPDSFWKKLANKVPEKFFASNFAKKMINMAEHNASLFESTFVLALCSTLRPITVMATPGAPVEDRKYAAAKSVATGIIGFALTAAVFIPIAAATKNLGKLAKEGILKNGFPAANSAKYKVVEYVTSYVPRFVVAPLEAMALFALVPPIVHKFLDKKPRQEAETFSFQQKTRVNPGSKGAV